MARKKILIDAFGGDFPELVISGVADALEKFEDVELIVVGNQKEIDKILKSKSFDKDRLEIIDCKEVVTNDDLPVDAILKKKTLL